MKTDMILNFLFKHLMNIDTFQTRSRIVMFRGQKGGGALFCSTDERILHLWYFLFICICVNRRVLTTLRSFDEHDNTNDNQARHKERCNDRKHYRLVFFKQGNIPEMRITSVWDNPLVVGTGSAEC